MTQTRHISLIETDKTNTVLDQKEITRVTPLEAANYTVSRAFQLTHLGQEGAERISDGLSHLGVQPLPHFHATHFGDHRPIQEDAHRGSIRKRSAMVHRRDD